MLFNEIMGLILPSLIALLLYSKVSKRPLSFLEAVCMLALFTFVTNCIRYLVAICVFHLQSLVFTLFFTPKYSLMATCIAILTAMIYRLIELNVEVRVKVESKDHDD